MPLRKAFHTKLAGRFLPLRSCSTGSRKNSLEFTIKNKLRDQQKADLPVFSQANFTSKRGHAGLGLSNVQELQKKYANLFVEYRIEGDKFIFTLTIA